MAVPVNETTIDDAHVMLYRWDEYRPENPEALVGVISEHHSRNRRTHHSLSVDAGGAKTFFPENGRDHSIFVTEGGDVYSKVRTPTDNDLDYEAGRHRKIVNDKLGALSGRAQKAAEMHNFLQEFAPEDQDTVMTIFETGPYRDADELYDRLTGTVLAPGDDQIDELHSAYGNVTDTEVLTNGRDTEDFYEDFVYGEEMREIYDHVLDVVSALNRDD